MDQEPDVIRQDIEETRSSLTEKIESLEQHVVATVQNAKDTVESTIEQVKGAVEDTVGTVKDTVSDTVESVKASLDVSAHAQRSPFLALGCSFAAGFLTGRILRGGHAHPDRWMHRLGQHAAREQQFQPAAQAIAPAYQSSPAPPSEPGMVQQLMSQFRPEIDMIKGMAIGAVMGVARDMVKQSLPKLAPQIDELMNSVTSKLGAEPIRRPMVDPGPRVHQPV